MFDQVVSTSQTSEGEQTSQPKDIVERLKWIESQSIALAIADMSKAKGYDTQKAKANLRYIEEHLAEVKSALEANPNNAEVLKHAEELLFRQRQILVSNPALGMEKFVVTRFTLGDQARTAFANKMGMPFSNYMGQMEVPHHGYNAEICEYSALDQLVPSKRTIFKPQHGEGIADLQMHWDGDRLMFTMPKQIILDPFYNQEYPNWHIYEMGLNDTEPHHVSKFTEPDLEFADPCYLPDGRILFTTNIGYNGIPCEHGARIIMNLAIYDPKTGEMRKIAFDQDGNWSPTVLSNGRIMYTRYEYGDLTHYFTRIVMHSNPDGTEAKGYYGSNSYWPNAFFDMQEVPGSNGQFVAIVSGHHGVPRAGRLVMIDPAKGRREADGVVQEFPFKDRKVEPVMKDRLVDGVWPLFSRPFPVTDKYYLVSCKPHPDALWGIYLVDVYDNMTLLVESEGDGYLTPLPVKKRPVPPTIPDRVVKGEKEATVFIQDIYTGEGLRGVPRGEVKRLRLFAYEYAYMKSPSDFDALGVQSGWDLKRVLGEVPVEADGSAIFKVPANTPISMQPLDADGNAIQWMRSWFTAMPGEMVSCIGCHEDKNMIPPPKKVIAASKKPVAITLPEGGVRPISFELEIQPVLDRNCVSCHTGENELLDLTDNVKQEYKRWGNYTTHRHMSMSYYNLHPYFYRQGPEAELYVLEPYEYHASNSELIQMIQKGHHGVTLPEKDMDALCRWVDLNMPYFGDFEIAGRYKETFEQYPRRQQLMQKYANVSVDWRKELRDYAAYIQNHPYTEVSKRELPQPNVEKLPKSWGFTVEEAIEMQKEKGGEVKREIEIAEGLNMSFVWIPEGSYYKGEDVGAATPANYKKVKIEKGFWMGQFEVSNQQYQVFVPTHDSRYHGEQWKDHTTPGLPANKPEQPVIRISMQEAEEYCRQLGAKTGLEITLPTEREWEWAARAGSEEAMWFGTVESDYGTYENLADYMIKDLAVWGLEPTVPMPDNLTWLRKFWDFVPRDREVNDRSVVGVEVGKYKPNPWGLYDIHGNVAELSSSIASGNKFFEGYSIVCGGSWRDRASKATAYYRRYLKPWQGAYNVGFRVVIRE